MTIEQLDNEMKQFLTMIKNGLDHMAWENFERLDITGFLDKFHETVEANDLQEILADKMPINMMSEDTDRMNLD